VRILQKAITAPIVTIGLLSSVAQASPSLVIDGTPAQVAGVCTVGAAWAAGGGLVADTASAKAPDPCGFHFTATTAVSPSTLTQSGLPTVAGGTYTLSFAIEDTSSGAGSGLFTISFDGTQVDHFRETGILAGKGYVTDFYTTGGISAFGEDNDLVANPGPSGSVLSFTGTSDFGSWYVDDISLVGPVKTSSIPEPATPIAMLLGIAGLALRRRRDPANAAEA
jgi:hypothetical protein